MSRVPRVAFFTDSFHEVNGVAHTSRHLEEYARRNGLPFFSVHAGPENRQTTHGSVTRFEMRRGRAQLGLDRDLSFDLWLWRRRSGVTAALKEFQPDLIHITGPGDFGIVGLILAKSLRLPLVASWHTNLHDYAGRRLEKLLCHLPQAWFRKAGATAERLSLDAVLRFYRTAQITLAPNQELVDLVERGTGRPCRLMTRGVDTELFRPERRDRADDVFTFGYVGRLTAEKNVRFLLDVEQALVRAGHERFRFLIAGQGSEAEWLRQNVRRAEFAGVLKGEALARAYANMDVFLFPSETDTFGNVVLEALASGAPAVVTAGGGPKFLVRSGETGFVASDGAAFLRAALTLLEDRELLHRMRTQARAHALTASWDVVFARVYQTYREALATTPGIAKPQPANAGLW